MQSHLESKKLVMIGVIQEQHGDRCRLFQQWKELDFPIGQDPLNQNGIGAVPVLVAIDEHGIVRSRRPNPRTIESEFLDKEFPQPDEPADKLGADFSNVKHWESMVAKSASPSHSLRQADSYLLWDPTASNAKKSIEIYQRLLKTDKQRGDIHFRLGVAHRMLYELGGQTSAVQFSKAVSHWESALATNRNQYIWWRRIQQYGPRLKKPYSFYDWVAQARKELLYRGEKPNGAELAQRARSMVIDTAAKNPDPKNEILLVEPRWVTSHINMVPTRPKPGDVVAVHVGFTVSKLAKWNHGTEPLSLWLGNPSSGARVSSKAIHDKTPYAQPDSQQSVSLSFEVQIPADATRAIEIDAFSIFNICESENDQCIRRRHNLKITIPVQLPMKDQ